MNRDEAKTLPPGSEAHYSAYVGPPEQWDFMGAMQLRLACALGLREHHKLLDFGCGSLRAGRLLMMYLAPGNYYGVEPNKWLVDAAIAQELGGEALIALKRPHFDYNDEFRADVFGVTFDFINAQSILSHTGVDLTVRALANFKKALAPHGLITATFVPNTKQAETRADGWHYPPCVAYSAESIATFARDAGLHCMRIPWHHPRQDWYLFAHDRAQLPTEEEAQRHLTGWVLRDAGLQPREV